MSKIQRLAPALANQIAAGEVVERPASVVKELVENAIDAGATRIEITIDLGGKRAIRVEDDGEGMTAEDAVLAIERHATSKIRSAADLDAIATLGFRGEALPSIASVSHFTLRTRARGEDSGTEVRVDGGHVASVRQVGAPIGTAIDVADLFFNLPARRKFLKADGAEASQVSRLVTQLALGYPEVGFTLTSAGRRVLRTPPAPSLKDRFYQLFGERDDLVAVQKEAAGLRIVGFVARLAEHGPVRGPQNVFVNRRIVRDRTIAHAITQAYAVATVKERSPEVHLFLEIDPSRVDVNVHPTKAEVRFLEQSLVHEVLRRALADALGQQAIPELALSGGAVVGEQDRGDAATARQLPGVFTGAFAASRWDVPERGSSADDSLASWGGEGGGLRSFASGRSTLPTPVVGGADVEAAGVDAVRPMIPLGQFRDTYIIAVDAEGISIIDQHVAHERVLFEQVMERLVAGRLDSQRLLTPLVLELSASQVAALEGRSADLERLGFEVDSFGGKSVRLSAVPAIIGLEEAADTIRALAEDLDGLDRGAPADTALRYLAATTACHAAVKANYPLTGAKMQYILDELRRTAYSTVCPHGRPVVLRLTRREVEKNFQRI